MKLLSNRIAVKLDEGNDITKGGIHIPQSAKDKPNTGLVVAVGPGLLDQTGKRIGVSVKVGDVVIFSKYHGMEIEVDDEKVLVVREEDILAVICD